jgi:hypothetical protein
MSSVIDLTDAVLAVERCLVPSARRAILTAVTKANPLDGAKVADVLSMYDETDSYLAFIEPWWDRRGARLAEELEGAGCLLSVAALAAILLASPGDDLAGRADELDELAERIARAAYARKQRVVTVAGLVDEVLGGDPSYGRMFTESDVVLICARHGQQLLDRLENGEASDGDGVLSLIQAAIDKEAEEGHLQLAPDEPLFLLRGERRGTADAIAHFSQVRSESGLQTDLASVACGIKAWQEDNEQRVL